MIFLVLFILIYLALLAWAVLTLHHQGWEKGFQEGVKVGRASAKQEP